MVNTNRGHHPMTKQFDSLADAVKFMFAGKATFTVVSNATGARFTYRLRRAEDTPTAPVFVQVLTGSDNENSYSYVGFVLPAKGYRHGGEKAKVAADAPSAKAIQWLLDGMLGSKGEARFSQVALFREGACGRCGRKLTVPGSIESGLGPECAGKFLAMAA